MKKIIANLNGEFKPSNRNIDADGGVDGIANADDLVFHIHQRIEAFVLVECQGVRESTKSGLFITNAEGNFDRSRSQRSVTKETVASGGQIDIGADCEIAGELDLNWLRGHDSTGDASWSEKVILKKTVSRISTIWPRDLPKGRFS